MFDPVNFADPQKFMPERFLEADGKTLKKVDGFLPFSIGRRQCLGESLARAELFLVFANFMRNFRISVPLDHEQPTTDRKMGLTVAPQKYLSFIEQRKPLLK